MERRHRPCVCADPLCSMFCMLQRVVPERYVLWKGLLHSRTECGCPSPCQEEEALKVHTALVRIYLTVSERGI